MAVTEQGARQEMSAEEKAGRRENRLGILLDKARRGVDYPVGYGAERFQFR